MLKLTAIFVEDNKTGGYTAFFKEIPEIVAQGNTIDEAEEMMFRLLPMVLVDSGKTEDKSSEHEIGKVTERIYSKSAPNE